MWWMKFCSLSSTADTVDTLTYTGWMVGVRISLLCWVNRISNVFVPQTDSTINVVWLSGCRVVPHTSHFIFTVWEMQPPHGTESHYQVTVVLSYTSAPPPNASMAWTGTLTLPFLDSSTNRLLDNCSRDILFWNPITCHIYVRIIKGISKKISYYSSCFMALFQLFHGEFIKIQEQPGPSEYETTLLTVPPCCIKFWVTIFSLFLNPLMTDIYLSCILYKTSVPTSQRTQSMSIRKASQ